MENFCYKPSIDDNETMCRYCCKPKYHNLENDGMKPAEYQNKEYQKISKKSW